jgi:hypothetical protein
MVNIKSKNGGNHWVVAVGVKKSSTAKSLTVNDILVIDPYQGKIRTLQAAMNAEGSGWYASQMKY